MMFNANELRALHALLDRVETRGLKEAITVVTLAKKIEYLLSPQAGQKDKEPEQPSADQTDA